MLLIQIQDLDTRIIIGSFSDEIAPKIFCEVSSSRAYTFHSRKMPEKRIEFGSKSNNVNNNELSHVFHFLHLYTKAYELGMYGADYAWILQESLEQHRWWENEEKLECSLKNLHSAVENVLLVSSFNNIVGGEKSISGLVNPKAVFFRLHFIIITYNTVAFFLFLRTSQTNAHFEKELMAMNITKPFSRFAPETYDAVWSIALTLKGAEEMWKLSRNRKKLKAFDYMRKDLVKDFLIQFSQLKFQGISVSRVEEKMHCRSSI